MIKAKAWRGKALKGDWELTLKIDGVRALWSSCGWLSRADKPLYNIPKREPGMPTDCEVFVGSFRDTIRATRTKHLKPDTPRITKEHLYSLDPIDGRLFRGTVNSPTAEYIRQQLRFANELGHEGLVLRQGEKWIKVKPEETHDVRVTDAVIGEGKHRGRLGALVTPLGEVGTGFSDEEREALWEDFRRGRLLGQTVEVSCMQFTPDGQFRHPVFVRMRPDKTVD